MCPGDDKLTVDYSHAVCSPLDSTLLLSLLLLLMVTLSNEMTTGLTGGQMNVDNQMMMSIYSV